MDFQSLADLFVPLINAYGGQFGWLVAAVAYVGTARLIIKPVSAAVRKYVKDSVSLKDDLWLEKFDNHPATKVAIFILDLLTSIKLSPIKKTEVLVVEKK